MKTRQLETRGKRKDGPVAWCQINTKTYVVITGVASAFDASLDVHKLLQSAVKSLNRRVDHKADGELEDGVFEWLGEPNLRLHANDANDHHLTYGVLSAALQAVDNWMSSPGNFHQLAHFQIFDGDNQVGHAYLTAIGLVT